MLQILSTSNETSTGAELVQNGNFSQLGADLVENGLFDELGTDVITNGSFTGVTELITNGDFATDSDWSKGTGWTISGGTANAISATGELSQTSIDFDTSKTYRIEYTISGYSGSGGVKARLKGAVWNTGTLREGNGTFTESITSTAENTIFTFVTSSSFQAQSTTYLSRKLVKTGQME